MSDFNVLRRVDGFGYQFPEHWSAVKFDDWNYYRQNTACGTSRVIYNEPWKTAS